GDDDALRAGVEERIDELRPRARDDAELRVLRLDAAHVVGRDAPTRVPDVAELARPTDRARRAAADPDLRFGVRQRRERRAVERPVLAVEGRLAAPERAHQADRLVAAPTAALERDAEEAELVLVPAHPEAEPKPSSGELLQRRRLLREHD